MICVGVPRVGERVKLHGQAIGNSCVADSSKTVAKGRGRSSLDHKSKAITRGATNRGSMDLELEIGRKSGVHYLLPQARIRYFEPGRRRFGMEGSHSCIAIREAEHLRRVVRCQMRTSVKLQTAGSRREVREKSNLLSGDCHHTEQSCRTYQNRLH